MRRAFIRGTEGVDVNLPRVSIHCHPHEHKLLLERDTRTLPSFSIFLSVKTIPCSAELISTAYQPWNSVFLSQQISHSRLISKKTACRIGPMLLRVHSAVVGQVQVVEISAGPARNASSLAREGGREREISTQVHVRKVWCAV
jgi:hypothetical protein